MPCRSHCSSGSRSVAGCSDALGSGPRGYSEASWGHYRRCGFDSTNMETAAVTEWTSFVQLAPSSPPLADEDRDVVGKLNAVVGYRAMADGLLLKEYSQSNWPFEKSSRSSVRRHRSDEIQHLHSPSPSCDDWSAPSADKRCRPRIDLNQP